MTYFCLKIIKMKVINVFFYVFFVVTFLSCQQEKKEELTRLQGNVFGTTYNIIYKSKVDYQQPIDSLFYNFNNSLSTYIPNSIISKVNKNDSTIVVDAYFIEAFNKAKKIHSETNGYFDPTIGSLIDAYGFGSGAENINLTSEEITGLLKVTGFDKIQLKNKKIEKATEIQFNVNAFAKGLGIDVIGRFLESKEVNNYLVEIGGEIRARGKKSTDKLWKVAIDDPNSDGTRSASKIIELDNQSMATSGNYRKFKLNDNGEKIVHTINPKTGLAKESNLLSVSVISKGDCADVDAYATAFLAMGLDETKAFLEKRSDLKVVLLFSDENGEVKEYTN